MKTMARHAAIGILLLLGCIALTASLVSCGSPASRLSYRPAVVPNSTFTIDRPQQWTDQSGSGKLEYTASGPGNGTYMLYASSVPSKLNGGPYGSKESYMQLLQQGWKQQVQGRIEYTKATTLAGRDAIESVATIIYKGAPHKTRQVIAEAPDGSLVRVSYLAPVADYDAYMPVMDKALASFKFG